jgi:protein-disulfide isomerase
LSEEKKPQSTSENTSSEKSSENISSETTSENTSSESTSENTSSETKHDTIDNSSNNQSQSITIKKSTYNNMMKGAVVAIAIAAFFGGYLSGTMDDSITNQNLLDAIEEIEITQAAPQAAPQPTPTPTAETTPSEPQLVRVSLDDDPVKGDPDAPVTIIEFSDFQCPFCSRFFQQTLPLIEKDYIETGKVKLVYRDLPLASIHPNAIPSHIAAECADEQGKFWEYHDILFAQQSQWNRLGIDDLKNTFKQYADDLELDAVSYDSCLDSSDIVNEINEDLVDARALGATGTPTFFIGTEDDGYVKITGAQPFTVFQANIDDLLS